jgi:thiamine biosynthesis protein ThiI
MPIKSQTQNQHKKGILIAYGELFLKSEGVKKLFQRRLAQNLRFFLEKEKISFKMYPYRERIFAETEQVKKAAKIIKRVFGVAWLSEALFLPEASLREFSEFVGKNYADWIKKNETFAIRLKLEKNLIKESREKVIDKIAAKINRKVDLKKPKKEIFIEIRKNGYWVYFKKQKGAGGLPSGSGGRVLSLVSGGIDSPVASYLIAKRGAENVWIHFHSFPLVSNTSIEKVKELARIFLAYQPNLKIYFVPFQKIQLEIKTKTPAKYRVLLYRRMMLKIAEKIAKKENCRALVVGESLGQVSSQTLPNIKISGQGLKIPVLRPLIGFDKEEIIRLAEKIGVFEISIRPQEDCCTLFAPKHQTAEGRIEAVKELESRLEISKTANEAVKGAKIVFFNGGAQG